MPVYIITKAIYKLQEYYRMFTLFFQNVHNQRSQKRVKSINISYCINHWQASNLNSHLKGYLHVIYILESELTIKNCDWSEYK